MAASTRRAIVPARPPAGETRPTCEETSLRRRLWKAPPRSTLHRLVAVPAHLDDGGLEAGAIDGGVEPGGGGAGVEDDVGIPRGLLRAGKAGRPGPRRAAARLSSMSTAVTSRARQPRRQRGTSSPTTPAPTTTMRSPGPAPPSHSALSAVSILAASVARRAGTPSGTGTRAVDGHVETVLVRMQAEHRAADQLRRALLDNSRRAIAVFDGEGNAPSWLGPRMRSHSLWPTAPLNTSAPCRG